MNAPISMTSIAALFANDIGRKIEEVIKVDQTNETVIAEEIDEYVVTDAIRGHYLEVLERYQETPQKPHEGVGIWISGFFGSGKSSFAKVLGLSIENRNILSRPAAERFVERVHDPKLSVVIKSINERIPTHTVIFDVSTDRGIRSGNQLLTEIMYKIFLSSLGYAKDIDLAEIEIGLEGEGKLQEFEAAFRARHGKEWNSAKDMVAFAIMEASAALHVMNPATFSSPDTWAKGRQKVEITTNVFADRVVELMGRRKPKHSVLFVVDEVGQFVARDVQKMLDLQGIIQALGVRSRNDKPDRRGFWVAVTSQEKLNELVSGLDDKKIELARLMDRFPLQVHLEPSDISEVTSRRVLSKKASAEAILGELFDQHRARLAQSTRLTADIALPELTRETFIDLYPLLPYQIDLIIQIVSGLRTQGGASKHVGGANRTIIKLAQQLLVHQGTNLANQQVGKLVRLDHVYDLVEGNIASEVRGKIASIPQKVQHPLAHAVAKVVCLLQFVKTVRRSAENIAAALHEAVDGDSRLTSVNEALAELEKAHMIRQDEGGYKIPTPAEDDWDQTRASIEPKRADENRLYSETLTGFWTPAPSFSLGDTKQFKAGLMIDGKETVSGDIGFHLQLAENAEAAKKIAEEFRRRSQLEPKNVFWVATLDEDIKREMREAFRSTQMIDRRARGATSVDETNLVTSEKVRQRKHMDELRRRLRLACLSGQIYFQGNDRSPDGSIPDVGKVAQDVLGLVLPDVYDRFSEASAKSSDLKAGVSALLTAENLSGLPPVFNHLGLLRDEQGKPVFKTDVTPLSEVMAVIESKASYGEQATGKTLEDEFAKVPFGWDFEAIRLLTLSLIRAGKIDAVSRGQTFDIATSVQAKEAFSNNNYFRAASYRPKKSIDFAVVVEASENYKDTFGNEVKELAASPLAAEIREEVERHEDVIESVLATLRSARLPGVDMLESALEQMKAIRRGSEDNAITTFNAAHKSIKDAIQRATQLSNVLTDPALKDLARAKEVVGTKLPVLTDEPDLDAGIAAAGQELTDRLAKETFFRELAAIEQGATAIAAEYQRRYDAALDGRVNTYLEALENLTQTPGWERLNEVQQDEISGQLKRGADRLYNNQTIRHLRSETEACAGRLATAIRRVHEILEGERLATLRIAQFFSGGIETEEQLEQALDGLREEISRLIGAGKKVIVT